MENKLETNIDFSLLWRVFKRFGLTIAVTGIIAGIIGFVLAHWVIKPTYQASALIFAWTDAENPPVAATSTNSNNENSNRIDIRLEQERALAKLRNSQLLSQQLTIGNLLMPDFQALLNSGMLREQINEALGEKIRFSIKATPLPRTRFVEVSVLCSNQEKAPEILNVAVHKFKEQASKLLGVNNTQIIDIDKRAVKVSPKPLIFVVGGVLLGLLLGSTVCFLIDFLDKSIRDINTLENDFNLPVLGVLPEVTTNNVDLWNQDTKSTYGEAVRSMRVNVEYLLPETGRAKIFLVSSISKYDGKTSIMSSLAVSIAKIEKRVLLVDTDLRRPRQHRVFKLSNKVGLVDLLVSNTSFDELVQRNVKVPGLDVLTCGTIPVNPTDLLGSRRFEDFLREQSQNYDYILLDAPPTLGFADPMILGNLADSTIITCDFKSANTDKLRVIINRLRKSNVRLGGLVINRFQLQNRSDYYYSYQHYYYQYTPDNEQLEHVNTDNTQG